MHPRMATWRACFCCLCEVQPVVVGTRLAHCILPLFGELVLAVMKEDTSAYEIGSRSAPIFLTSVVDITSRVVYALPFLGVFCLLVLLEMCSMIQRRRVLLHASSGEVHAMYAFVCHFFL